MSATWSHSRIGLYDQCPLAYRYRYLEGVPDAFTTIEQHLGRVVHDVLERAYAERSQGRPVDGRWMAAAYERLWGSADLEAYRIVKPGKTADAYRGEGLAMVGAYHARVFSVDTSETVSLEHRFSLDLDAGAGVAWAGIIDRLARRGDGMLRIIDYKTGTSPPDPRTDRQLQSYALHVFEEHRVDTVELCIEGLRAGVTLAAPFSASQAGGVRTHLLARIVEIERSSAWPARPTALCAWCGFNVICPEAGWERRPSRRRPASRGWRP
jgi:putative RecB family exonuclease